MDVAMDWMVAMDEHQRRLLSMPLGHFRCLVARARTVTVPVFSRRRMRRALACFFARYSVHVDVDVERRPFAISMLEVSKTSIETW